MTVSNVQNNNKHTYYTPKLFVLGATTSTVLASKDISNYIKLKPKLKGSSIATKREFLGGVLSNLDIPHYDVTREAKGYEKWINDHIWHLNRMQKQPDEVVIAPSDQCCDPYECWYYGYCHNDE